MAAKKPKDNSAALAADEGAVVPRISLGEKGFNGLRTINGRVYEDTNRAFQFPQFFCTIDEMRKTAIIASALNIYKVLLSRVTWSVEAPVGASEEEKERAKFIESLKDDMENSWTDFIADVVDYLPYGYSVQEKVYRRRLYKNGSRYNDGKIGLRRISPRAQETIEKWEFSKDGRDLLGVYQSVARMENSYLYSSLTTDENLIHIPREKFLLFSADGTRGNPLGQSVLKGVYLAWKQRAMLIDQEILGAAKEAANLPVIRMPAQYMSPEASEDQKAVYKASLEVLQQLADGTSTGIAFPTFYNQDSKKDEFDISLLDQKGFNGAGIDTIIRRYTDDILSALSVDILKAGTNTGSFSLADNDTNVLALAMGHRLKEIASVLNHDLIPQVYALNGWKAENLPKFVQTDISDVSIEEFSKGMQRLASTGVMEIDRAVLNKAREVMGIQKRPDDEPVDKEALSTNVSNSGKSFEAGRSGDGTSVIGGDSSGQDRSSNNSENAA